VTHEIVLLNRPGWGGAATEDIRNGVLLLRYMVIISISHVFRNSHRELRGSSGQFADRQRQQH
jgi:hypothetical protein